MQLKKVYQIAAGSPDQIFALAKPKVKENYTIYRKLGLKWVPLPGRGATSISLGQNGTIYLTDADKRIYQSKTFNATWEQER